MHRLVIRRRVSHGAAVAAKLDREFRPATAVSETDKLSFVGLGSPHYQN